MTFYNEESEEEMEYQENSLQEYSSKTFTARSYQEELFEIALEKNSILVLGTGSGKTFISILMIKALGSEIRGKLSEGAKRTVFVVNTVPLVYQQALAIEQQTGYSVGRFEGSMEVDYWTDDKWSEELDKCEVLVMVAQIFSTLILHQRLPLSKVNLIIMDECHHATGKHPMRDIMREYISMREINACVPRVMGLTACVIHKRCKVPEVEKYMTKLENTMDCSLVTSRHTESVKKFSTKAEICIVCFRNYSSCKTYSAIKDQLINISARLSNEFSMQCSSEREKDALKKFISKQVNGIIDVSNDLGDYVLHSAIKLQIDYLLKMDSDISALEANARRELGQELEVVWAQCDSLDLNRMNPLPFLSGKLKRLLEIITNSKFITLVFVTRRNTAKLLSSLLVDLKEKGLNKVYKGLDDLYPESVVGGSGNPKFDLRVNDEAKKQKETLERFRKGECNLIISTSVLEEGLDVRKCNLVVRFDEPANYRSYIQSIGRARAEKALYIILTPENGDAEVIDYLDCYQEITDLLSRKCHNRDGPSIEDSIADFNEDMIEPPFAPYGADGPKITFNSAVQLINKYCGSLPQDKFTNLTVRNKEKWTEFINNETKYFISFRLPLNSPYKEKAVSNPMDNYEDAKKSAALEMCKKLHQVNLLNDSLLPRKTKVEEGILAQKYLNLTPEVVPLGKPKPGTRKRRMVYKRRISKALRYNEQQDWYLHCIHFEHVSSPEGSILLDSDRGPVQLGLLTGGPLKRYSFPLFSKKFGRVHIKVELIGQERCHDKLLQDVKQFHCIVSQLFLKLNMNIMRFSLKKSGHSSLLVPLQNKSLDYHLLESVNELSLFMNGKRTGDKNHGFKFETDKYEGKVVLPSYRDPEIFMVEKILMDKSPLSPFPEIKKYSSYKEYVQRVYEAEVTTDDQPLLECKHFSKEFSFLADDKVVPTKSKQSKHPLFIPELCYVLPFAASLWYQILCMASVLHRINGLQLEQELYLSIGYCASREEEQSFTKLVDYSWVETELTKLLGNSEMNLTVVLRQKKEFSIYSGMILQTLTPLKSKENFNLERLEVLGDAYLKFSVGRYLFCKESSSYEGTLTTQRSELVSNRTLSHLAKLKNLGGMFQGVMLQSFNAIPYGFCVPEETETLLKDSNVPPEEWASYSVKECDGKDPSEEAFNPWTEQLVPDKCIADCVEALIGVYLLLGGEGGANHLMRWLGFTFIHEEVRVPQTAEWKEENKAASTVAGMYRANCLDRLEDILQYSFKDKSFILQAVTHPSYAGSGNRTPLTDSYQRLEFFGDAVLDYLVTGHIFSTFKNYDPGQLTDLRSHYVKNETLAKIAVTLGLERFLLHNAPKLAGTIQAFKTMLDSGEREFNVEDDTNHIEDVEVPKALGDMVEALIGGVYIDSGESLEVSWNVIKRLLATEMKATEHQTPIDCVRSLYERCPDVKICSYPPTDDEPARCVINLPGYPELTGTGKNKRTAKQAVAKLALARMDITSSS